MKQTAKFVYIMRVRHTYKVGVSSNPDLRAKDLQTGNPHKVVLIEKFGPFDNAYTIERKVHYLLRDLCSEGEWFSCTLGTIMAAVLDAIKDPSKVEALSRGLSMDLDQQKFPYLQRVVNRRGSSYLYYRRGKFRMALDPDLPFEEAYTSAKERWESLTV